MPQVTKNGYFVTVIVRFFPDLVYSPFAVTFPLYSKTPLVVSPWKVKPWLLAIFMSFSVVSSGFFPFRLHSNLHAVISPPLNVWYMV